MRCKVAGLVLPFQPTCDSPVAVETDDIGVLCSGGWGWGACVTSDGSLARLLGQPCPKEPLNAPERGTLSVQELDGVPRVSAATVGWETIYCICKEDRTVRAAGWAAHGQLGILPGEHSHNSSDLASPTATGALAAIHDDPGSDYPMQEGHLDEGHSDQQCGGQQHVEELGSHCSSCTIGNAATISNTYGSSSGNHNVCNQRSGAGDRAALVKAAPGVGPGVQAAQEGGLAGGLPSASEYEVAFRLIELPFGRKAAMVAAGEQHALVLTSDGCVFAWGGNSDGQAGTGERCHAALPPACVAGPLSPHEPTSPLGRPCVHVSAGARHSAAVTSSGELLTWGWGLYGQLGHGDEADATEPQPVRRLGGLRVIGAACGLAHTVAWTEDGAAYAWGANEHGQLGLGDDGMARLQPELIDSHALAKEHITKVSCGARHTAVLTSSGEVYTFGWNGFGQLGRATLEEWDGEPRRWEAAAFCGRSRMIKCHAQDIACGWWHTAVLLPSSSSDA